MISTNTHHRTLALSLLAAALILPGCAAAVPLVSAGASAGEAGYSFWQSGKLVYVDEGTTTEMNEAVERTLDRLNLTIDETKLRDSHTDELDGRWWSIHSDHGHLVTLETRPHERHGRGEDQRRCVWE
ncbi:MAG: hypothetical protein R3B67_13570 [Phycisphaerales bacterium]